MARYLAGRRSTRDPNEVEVYGTVEAEDIAEALDKAHERWGDDIGVMPPSAVDKWMRRGAAVNEARNLAVASER